ncbi:glycerol-3-phosphate dehydrogenase (NAD(P)+) [Propionibacterium cyclohexanicum]|uniref:Glycerol-3-phosphate dehydrogenase (NAD(P)+) n=1 Tax=Propionibacterium cyclohexanicum TaxID=64702 RepID=A0A1H9TQ82_9ACTN|nr:glycerol-3-phosphate dehydrogenase [Propionibacterium cyclohexanicum]SER99211.1 glycerol-3-phosphate dehydrogenase (NAD(P)+) [Propionibacterium cyclohexanicum]
MAIIAVLGAGVMASALTNPARDNGHEVRLIGTHLDDEIIASVKQTRVHPVLGVELDAGVKPYYFGEAGDQIAGADVVMVGVNSFGIDWAGEQLARFLHPGQKVLVITKGLQADANGDLHILPHVLQRAVGPLSQQVTWSAIVGPCIAGELAIRRPSCVVFNGEDPESLEYLANLYRTDYYHVWTSTEFIAHEVGAATKNVFAFAQGFAHGILSATNQLDAKYVMYNYSAALFAEGSREIHQFIELLGGDPKVADGLGGVGDMFVTSMGGRNVKAGGLVGAGIPFSQVREVHMRGITLEGVAAIKVIGAALEKLTERGVVAASDFPLVRFLYDLVVRDGKLDIPWDSFFGGHHSLTQAGASAR